MLGVLPGLFHAWYIIATYPDPTYDELAQQDSENGRVTHYYIDQGQAPPAQGQRAYGTVGNAPHQQFPGQQAGVAPPAQYVARYEGMQCGEGSAGAPPPTYQESVKADHKMQRPE